MEAELRQIRYNPMKITSIAAFGSLRGRGSQGQKQVYFIRCIGYDETYLENIYKMEEMLAGAVGKGVDGYDRIGKLSQLSSREEIVYYTEAYRRWREHEGGGLSLKNIVPGSPLEAGVREALAQVRDLFRAGIPHGSESIVRNFMIKLLYWSDQVIPPLCQSWKWKENYKLAVCCSLKRQEYLFCVLLTLLGIDVLILSPEKEVDAEEALLNLSHKIELGKKGNIDIPQYHRKHYNIEGGSAGKGDLAPEGPAPAKVIIPPRRSREPKNQFQPMTMAAFAEGREKTFEELALLASSIVMISILDKQNEVMGSGSGIMVGPEGYILTNNHVALGGTGYLVRIEDDETVYQTREVVKYHSLLDLALIHIERRLTPLPIYKGERKLARGQRVVAIGSPLGFFNSVSDGIISGFRRIRDVDMIQFTAPISHGSSGGALLNMQGQVIGISTAGVDNGQNINLAVEYRDIYAFVKGFL